MNNRNRNVANELRTVLFREQMTSDPQIDLSRTAFNPLLLLTKADLLEVQETLGIAIDWESGVPTTGAAVEESKADFVYSKISLRLAEFLVTPPALGRPKARPRPKVHVETASQGAMISSNHGGEMKVVKAGQWYPGPAMLFSGNGSIIGTTVEFETDPPDVNIICMVRKANSVLGCLIVNSKSASAAIFNGLSCEGYWGMSFLALGSGVPNIQVKLHQLAFTLG